MIADDDADDLDLLCEAFHSIDPEVEIIPAMSSSQFLDLVKNTPPDQKPLLFIIDYNMPFLNGADLIERLCEQGSFSSVPKVVWSTSDSAYYKKLCKDKGADYYFTKPHTFTAIEEVVQKLLLIAKTHNGSAT